MFERVLISGGAGFVGSNLAIMLKGLQPGVGVVAIDSLKRRGSELRLPHLRDAGVQFHHGDVRNSEDFDAVGDFDLLIDCSAEPSVHAGIGGSPYYVLNTNLQGTIHCLEQARLHSAAFMLLSTSRVFPIRALNDLAFEELDERFRWLPRDGISGFSSRGISESFTLDGARSLYGASKLASEILVTEFAASYGMRTIINRCGVIAGPWQMGKADQGIVALWVARHYFRRPLRYIGFGGEGKQVRDVLHVADLFDLICKQINDASDWQGQAYNIGGGMEISTSLLELSRLCSEVTGYRAPIGKDNMTSSVDVRLYISDCQKSHERYGWRPRRGVPEIVADIHDWISEHEAEVAPILSV